MAKRPRLVKVDAEMQRWCASIEDEVSTWPRVTTRPMFGLAAFYRGANIFAAVARTRAVGNAYSIIVKLPGVTGERLTATIGPGRGWLAFAIESEQDVAEALRWIERAYEKANRKTPAKKR